MESVPQSCSKVLVDVREVIADCVWMIPAGYYNTTLGVGRGLVVGEVPVAGGCSQCDGAGVACGGARKSWMAARQEFEVRSSDFLAMPCHCHPLKHVSSRPFGSRVDTKRR
jgi:hypothetical protein